MENEKKMKSMAEYNAYIKREPSKKSKNEEGMEKYYKAGFTGAQSTSRQTRG